MALSVRSDIEPIDPSAVSLWVAETFVDQCFQVAAVAVIIFDTIITLDKEAKYFWKVPRRPVDFVYFANRYIGIFGAIALLFGNMYGVDSALCNFTQWSIDIANWTTVILIDYILAIRVLALYSRDRRLSICLYTLLALEAALKLGIIIYGILLEHVAVARLAKDVTACNEDSIPVWRWGLVDWMIPLMYGVILMVLTLYKAAEYWKMSAGFKGFTLVKVLIEDHIMYFMLAISVSVFVILGFKVQLSNDSVAGILPTFGSPSFLSVLGSRMLFNLKEAGERGENEGTSYRSPSWIISSMEFAEPVNAEVSQTGEAESEDPSLHTPSRFSEEHVHVRLQITVD